MDILLGGLGLGFSLGQVLACRAVRRVCVVELVSRVVSWNRFHLGNADLLDDSRTEVVVGDFCEYVQGAPKSYHGIALDIDNGPEWVVRPENRRSYSLSMLETLSTRLRPGGALAIWAQGPSKSYERALQEVFTHVELRTTEDRSPNGKALESVIYVARG